MQTELEYIIMSHNESRCSMPTLTAHVSDELIADIDAVSERLDRSRAWVVKEAVREYLARRAEDQKRWSETLDAIEAADRGEVIAADEVLRWLDTWGMPGEKLEDAD
jgi:predicted transcriptional regulator